MLSISVTNSKYSRVGLGPKRQVSCKSAVLNETQLVSKNNVVEFDRPGRLLSRHPDAIRRRQEAEARRREIEETRAEADRVRSQRMGWWEVDCPENMSNVTSLADLQFALTAHGDKGLVVLNYFAEECYACKSLQPKLRQIAAAHSDVLFLKINGSIDEFQNFCEKRGITRIPYFQLYRGGQIVSEFVASLRPEKLALLRGEIGKHKAASAQLCPN